MKMHRGVGRAMNREETIAPAGVNVNRCHFLHSRVRGQNICAKNGS